MTSIRRKLFFLLTALLALPMQAQVNLVYVDSARVARLLAEDAGLVAAPVAEVADTDTVPLADRPVVADGADFDRLWTDSFADRMAAIVEDPLLQSTQMAVMVWDLSADQCVYRFNEAQRMRPASVQSVSPPSRPSTAWAWTISFHAPLLPWRHRLHGRAPRFALLCRWHGPPLWRRQYARLRPCAA